MYIKHYFILFLNFFLGVDFTDPSYDLNKILGDTNFWLQIVTSYRRLCTQLTLSWLGFDQVWVVTDFLFFIFLNQMDDLFHGVSYWPQRTGTSLCCLEFWVLQGHQFTLVWHFFSFQKMHKKIILAEHHSFGLCDVRVSSKIWVLGTWDI